MKSKKVVHELAHIVVELEDHSPVLDPDQPLGVAREFLGNVIGLVDHPKVHALLRKSGLYEGGESRNALKSFLKEANTVHFEAGKVHPFMAVGFANMALTHSIDESALFQSISETLGERSAETLGAGNRIVDLVVSQRETQSLDTVARRVCDILTVRTDYRNAIWPWDRKVLRQFKK